MAYETFQNLNYIWMAIGALIFLLLLNVTAPYGRHSSSKWGPQVSNRLGWIIMEAPGMILLMYFVITHASRQNLVSLTLVAFFLFHYINRTFIFPFRIRTKAKKMPLVIMVSAIFFNLVNGFLLGFFFARFAQYPVSDLFGLRFIIGAVLFALGMWINWDHDNRLIHLRQPGETGYKIPTGGLFNYISCPNHLGEIIEWTGFAIMCWNLPAFSFLFWTVANLLPRALSHHKWYKEHFGNYPAGRKAIIPFVL
jgi:3-oxo-5-alpha-steroid 4-dehydrogenase 1